MSRIKKAMYETAKDLYEVGGLGAATMRKVEAACLPQVKQLSGGQIKQLRARHKASQAVFAAYLNVSPSTLQQWEAGRQKPQGPSLKLLNVVDAKGLEALA